MVSCLRQLRAGYVRAMKLNPINRLPADEDAMRRIAMLLNADGILADLSDAFYWCNELDQDVFNGKGGVAPCVCTTIGDALVVPNHSPRCWRHICLLRHSGTSAQALAAHGSQRVRTSQWVKMGEHGCGPNGPLTV